jgi:hypothetical protein
MVGSFFRLRHLLPQTASCCFWIIYFASKVFFGNPKDIFNPVYTEIIRKNAPKYPFFKCLWLNIEEHGKRVGCDAP